MDKQIDVLNSVLNGEKMAVDLYGIVLNKLEDEAVRKEIKNLQVAHKSHVESLFGCIQNQGGKVKNEKGIQGFLAEIIMKLKTIGEFDLVEALMVLYKGEEKGIVATEKFLDELNEENRQKVVSIIAKDEELLEVLKTIIEKRKVFPLH